MTYETFDKVMCLIRAWREKTDHSINEWPDSRDPEFREQIAEFKVVPQEVEKALVALAAWRHGSQDVYQGMSAVAKVIVNRQNQGMFRSHVSDADQFPEMAGDTSDLYPDKGQDFEKLLENIDDILQSKVVDLTQGATHFGRVDSSMSEQFRTVVNTKTRTVKVGSTTFFK